MPFGQQWLTQNRATHHILLGTVTMYDENKPALWEVIDYDGIAGTSRGLSRLAHLVNENEKHGGRWFIQDAPEPPFPCGWE